MTPPSAWLSAASAAGVLLDANLLVLLVVGLVNPKRIESFKRTRSFVRADYDRLLDLLGKHQVWSLAHVLSEVSNLTDLPLGEGSLAREFLREYIEVLEEPVLPSRAAAHHPSYVRLGLTDAAIATAARIHQFAVLTNDLGLFLQLEREKLPVIYFTYYRAAVLGY